LLLVAGLGRKAGFVAYVDENTRWTAVHRNDAAACFRLAFEKGKAGATYLPIGEGAVKLKDTMTVVGKKLGLPVVKKTPEELAGVLGVFSHLLGADTPVDNEKTRKELGWEPKEVGFLEDIEKNFN
jgi:nucleoside-diphosphate-sugar epimerase